MGLQPVRVWSSVLAGAGAALICAGFYSSGRHPAPPPNSPLLRTVRRPTRASRKPVRKKGAHSAAVVYRRVVSAGVPLHVVQVDLRRPEVRTAVVTPGQGIGAREEWSVLVNRSRPAAAITGTY